MIFLPKEALFYLIVLWIVLYAFAALLIASVILAWKLSGMLLHPKIWDYATVVDEEEKRGHFTRTWFESECRLEEFTLRSQYGYDLHCALWPRSENAAFADGKRRVAVIVHGYTYCLLGSVKYAMLFHDLGFDCVLYDHRNHGLSGKAPTTMGYFESRDLTQVCSWALERFGADAVLGTHGESMGAATVMLHAPQYPKLAFVIEDCGYRDLSEQVRHNIRHSFHLPSFPFVPLASLMFRLRGGVFFRQVVPKDAVAKCDNLPMLFIHGQEDTFVPYEMVHVNYAAKPGQKEIRTFPQAAHAKSLSSDPEGYRACVKAFLEHAGVI